MIEAMLILIAALVVIAVVTCVLLVIVQLNESAATRATAERRLLQVRCELRKLRKELAGK